MCGDIESDETLAEDYYQRFVERTQKFLSSTKTDNSNTTDNLYNYLDNLFRQTLSATTNCDETNNAITGYERISMEPLVYARIAGFIAAHQPIQDDPLRNLIEALLTGYAEGESTASNIKKKY